MTKEVLLEFHPHQDIKILTIAGKNYVFAGQKKKKSKDGFEALVFKQVDKTKYLDRITGLAEKIAPSVKPVVMVKMALRSMPIEDIEIIEKELAKRKPKIKAKEGCYYLKIGKARVSLRE